jgi:hypothetical protein
MEQLFIKKIKTQKSVNLSKAENLLEQQSVTNTINNLNWADFQYKPTVRFRIGHVDDEIWLKYYVKEKHIKAMETRTNGNVYKDSCVEFFISFDGQNYYNLEINCIGTIHLAYGTGRHGRNFVDPSIIEKIETRSSLGDKPFEEKSGNFEWEIMVRIPIECFTFSKLSSLKNRDANANFYKCGDDTSEPHYITWNPVKTENPDYHRPEFFGKVHFE